MVILILFARSMTEFILVWFYFLSPISLSLYYDTSDRSNINNSLWLVNLLPDTIITTPGRRVCLIITEFAEEEENHSIKEKMIEY